MAIMQTVAPTVEPITLAQAKAHLRVESVDFSTDVDSTQSIAPGSHAIAAAYSLEGTAVEVLGYDAVVNLEAGTCGGTVDVKLQERDSESEDWADVSSGAFTQVDEDNDNATFEKAYTGTKRYIRVVVTVATAACEFAVVMVRRSAVCEEDDLITALIVAAREYAEGFQNRAYITQTWQLWLDDWPGRDYIEIPLPPLQEPAVTAGSFVTGTVFRILTVGTTDFTLIGAASDTVGVCFKATGAGTGTGTATASGTITYYGTDDTAYYASGISLAKEDQYEPKVYLRNGQSWPGTTLRPHNGICVTYVAGYGDAAADVPQKIRQALYLLIAHFYENREAVVIGQGFTPTVVPMAVEALLWQDRIVEL